MVLRASSVCSCGAHNMNSLAVTAFDLFCVTGLTKCSILFVKKYIRNVDNYCTVLPRDTMSKHSLCCHPVSVRPSVIPSVTLVYCIHTAEDIVELLSRPSCPIILVFLTPSTSSQFQGNPFSGGAKYMGWENFVIFDWNQHLSRKHYEIGPWLLWNINRKS